MSFPKGFPKAKKRVVCLFVFWVSQSVSECMWRNDSKTGHKPMHFTREWAPAALPRSEGMEGRRGKVGTHPTHI
jgi:hypothetical protein